MISFDVRRQGHTSDDIMVGPEVALVMPPETNTTPECTALKPPDRPIRLFLIDESTLTYAGLEAILNGQADIEIAGYAHGADSALENCGQISADVILINAMSKSVNISEVTQRVSQLCEDCATRMLFLASDPVDPDFLTGKEPRVRGVILAREEPTTILAAIRMVSRGYWIAADSLFESPRIRPSGRDRQNSDLSNDTLEMLTRREHEVLQLLAKGLKNAEIAAELVLSESTIKSHVQNVLSKLGSRNRATAVAISYELGIVQQEADDANGATTN